jgi:hypothetical protein
MQCPLEHCQGVSYRRHGDGCGRTLAACRLAGTPAACMPSGISIPGVTVAPAAIRARLPTLAPSSTVAPLPISHAGLPPPCRTDPRIHAVAILVAVRRSPWLEVAVKGIDAGDCVLALPADVTQAVDLDRLMNEAQARFGTLDGVSANAGAGMTDHYADCPA